MHLRSIEIGIQLERLLQPKLVKSQSQTLSRTLIQMESHNTNIRESLRTATTPAQRRAFKTKKCVMKKTVNNLYSQRRCHSQYNVKVSIVASSKLD